MSADNFELVTLRNGSRAVREKASGEVMHPSVGPWAEARALYVDQPRLKERLAQGSTPCVVLDLGLGAAANAAAVLACHQELSAGRRPLHLRSFEQDLGALELALSDPEGFPFLVPFAPWCRTLCSAGRVEQGDLRWELFQGDALAHLGGPHPPAELVLFDPFSPESNPAFWTRQAFAQVRANCGPDALLCTYSASTSIRVSMLLGGFFVGQGASVGTKKETTVAAVRKELLERPLDQRWLERWSRSSARAPWGETWSEDVQRGVLAHPQFLEI